MLMSRPSSGEFAALNELAFEIREIFDTDAFNIDIALGRHKAFRRGQRPRSSLIRSLIAHSAEKAEIRTGQFMLEDGPGGSISFRKFDGDVERYYRILKAKVINDEIVLYGNKSILNAEGDSLYAEERWVFAYTVDDDNVLDKVFIAEILDVTDGNPGRLVLDECHYLGVGVSTPPGGGRFVSTNEDLDLPDDEDETGEASEAS